MDQPVRGKPAAASPQAAVLARLLGEHAQIRTHLCQLGDVLAPEGPNTGGAAKGTAAAVPQATPAATAAAAAGGQTLARLLERHVLVEDNVLFPSLEQALGEHSPTLTMRLEHEHVTELIDRLVTALAAGPAGEAGTAAVCLHQLGQLLPDHLAQEEGTVFRVAQRRLAPAAWEAMATCLGLTCDT